MNKIPTINAHRAELKRRLEEESRQLLEGKEHPSLLAALRQATSSFTHAYIVRSTPDQGTMCYTVLLDSGQAALVDLPYAADESPVVELFDFREYFRKYSRRGHEVVVAMELIRAHRAKQRG